MFLGSDISQDIPHRLYTLVAAQFFEPIVQKDLCLEPLDKALWLLEMGNCSLPPQISTYLSKSLQGTGLLPEKAISGKTRISGRSSSIPGCPSKRAPSSSSGDVNLSILSASLILPSTSPRRGPNCVLSVLVIDKGSPWPFLLIEGYLD